MEGLGAVCKSMVESEKFTKMKIVLMIFLFIGVVIICIAVGTKTTKGNSKLLNLAFWQFYDIFFIIKLL